jgi:predicted DNA-binding antitoxin AbrB/MazE fold protein
MQLEAIYQHGVLKPLQPLDLAENEHVSLLVTPAPSTSRDCQPDVEYTQSLQTTLQDEGPAPGLDEVRRLSKIPGNLTADFIAEREDR